MPARRKGLQATCFQKAGSTGCSDRRKRVSARHQVKRLDRIFKSRKPIRQKKQVFFVRCGSTGSAISPGPKPGRDLVLTCSPTPSFHMPGDVPGVFKIPVISSFRPSAVSGPCDFQRASGPRSTVHGVVFAILCPAPRRAAAPGDMESSAPCACGESIEPHPRHSHPASPQRTLRQWLSLREMRG
jgi:hypothetical protein